MPDPCAFLKCSFLSCAEAERLELRGLELSQLAILTKGNVFPSSYSLRKLKRYDCSEGDGLVCR